MGKKWVMKGCSLSLAIILLILTGCAKKTELKRFDAQFLGVFDTVTSIIGYAEDKEAFTIYAQEFYEELKEYHQLYDIYNNYEGINNIKTINDQAGIAPVQVDQKIIDLLRFSKEMYEQSEGMMNVAMGSVLTIWHDYRSAGIENPEAAAIPPMEVLQEAAKHIDLDKVVIDYEAATVYIEDPQMSLDVGSIGKGYATEQVCLSLEKKGVTKALVSVGGNVRAIGTKEGGEKWQVGIQNPDVNSEQTYLHTVAVEDASLVTSGSYQRYYTVSGIRYHHIVHPDLLTPWNEYDSVSILCKDSGLADALTTALFNMELAEGMALVEGLEGVEAMWIKPDKTEYYTSGFVIDETN